MIDVINRIRAKKAEQAFLLGVLALWDAAKQAGYDSDQIKAFTFRPEFLTPQEKKQNRRAWMSRTPEPIGGGQYHNCVRLVTGELRPIPLTERPYDPAKK